MSSAKYSHHVTTLWSMLTTAYDHLCPVRADAGRGSHLSVAEYLLERLDSNMFEGSEENV